MTSSPGRRADVIAVAILAGILTLLCLDVLAGINVLYARDIAHYYYPAKHVLREIVLGGEFPYWNPYFGAGQPMAANPEHEVFYPLTWMILLPNFRVAFHLLVLLHVYVAALTMYALLRSMRLQPAGAFFGALSYALGGIVVSYLNLLPYLFSIAWLPLTCLFTRRFLLRHAWRDFAAASFFFGVQLLVGEPSTILQTGLLLGFYAVYRCVQERSVVPLLRVAFVSAGAFGVGAVQTMATLDHASDSVRAGGLPYGLATDWSMPWFRFGELLHPNFLGHLDLEGRILYWGAALYPDRAAPFLYSLYPGLLATVLAIAGVLGRVRGRALTLAVVAISFALALGGNAPLWPLLHELGLVSWMRYPEKFALMAVFAVIVFGARALDELLRGDARVRRCAFLVALIVTAAAAIAAVLARTPLYPPLFLQTWEPRGGRVAAMIAASATGWAVAAARAAAVLLLVRKAESRRPWLAMAAAFVVVDLGMVLFQAVPRMPPRYYDEPPPLAQRLPANRPEWRLFHHADWHRTRPAVRPYFERHPDHFWVRRNGLMPMMPAQYGIRMALESDYDLTALRPTDDFVRSVAELSDLRPDWVDVAASMSNVWYRAVFRVPEEAFAEARGDRRVLNPLLVLPLPHYPRYYFAERVERIADRADFVRKLAGARYGKRTAFTAGPSFMPAAGRVVRVQESANRARIEVETAGRAFLIISVTPHKYWRITVDGTEARAVVTNVGYQGVVVPSAGQHVIEMRYRNSLIPAGAAVSLASLLALAFITMRRL